MNLPQQRERISVSTFKGVDESIGKPLTKSVKTLDNSGESGIIKQKDTESLVKDVHYIGKIDIEKYKDITDKEILSEEVIITDNRINHIIERRGVAFFEEYKEKFADIVTNPDCIFKDKKANTAIACKSFSQNGENVNLVVHLVVEGDDPSYKNSIITAIKENNKRFAQRLRNNKPVYQMVDNNE